MGSIWRRTLSALAVLRRRSSIAVVLGLAMCSAVVWHATDATFSATTSNQNNTVGAGSVTISDNDGGSAMFTAADLAPGATNTACIGVTYTGSLNPSAVKLYFSGAQESNNGGAYGAWANDAASEMDDNTNLQIQVNDTDLAADPGNSCNPVGVGTFADIAAVAPGTGLRTLLNSNTTFLTGLPSLWGTVTPGRWRVFRFVYTFSASAPNSAQGDGVRFTVVWEARS